MLPIRRCKPATRVGIGSIKSEVATGIIPVEVFLTER
jgi:hypothetical protein